MEMISVRTQSESELRDITREVQEVVRETQISDGIVHIFVPHTTAGVTINENADPTVRHDLLADLDRLVPRRQAYYQHREGNSCSHLKASLFGSSVTVIVNAGELVLGTWQGIFFCEFDGPRTRKVYIKISQASD